LLVSDLHLGEACKEHSRIEYLKRGAEFDTHFCAFLDHFRRNPIDGRPWRLVLGGDLIDFLQVTITPPGASAEARRYGLGTQAEQSVWKFDRVVERHRRVFVFLADFVGAGNRLEIIQGNHDVELFWPEVRQHLIDALVHLYFGEESSADEQPEDFRARVRFNPWFFYEPNLLYVEHGHRFDEFCTTPPQLCPLCPGQEDELIEPLSGLAIRYFANLERGFRTHDKEHWGVREYYSYYRAQGVGKLLEVGHRYVAMVVRMVRYHLQHGRSPSAQAEAEHQRQLEAIAADGSLPMSTLQTLQAWGAPSAMSLPFELYTLLGLAEWSAALALGLMALLVWAVSWPNPVEYGLLGATAIAGFVWTRLARARLSMDIRGKLERHATRISALLKVPVVAFGHSHAPRKQRMAHDHKAFYINTGCFLPPDTPAHTADEPCRCTATFVTLPVPGPYERATPTLQRWCCVDDAPAPL
jgi:UDP-2,3-diacylglucosamine pyrophosphatase LpxH